VTLWEVNLWVYAFRSDSPLHHRARAEMEEGSRSGDAYLFCPHVAASFLRLVTNPRIFVDPSGLAEAWAFVDEIECRDRAMKVDAMTWGVFKHLCLATRATGNSVPDAFLASIAIRHDATLVTADRRFERYQGLDCRFLDS
jgi:toxin-antitoxin system PIN domain toxin